MNIFEKYFMVAGVSIFILTPFMLCISWWIFLNSLSEKIYITIIIIYSYISLFYFTKNIKGDLE